MLKGFKSTDVTCSSGLYLYNYAAMHGMKAMKSLNCLNGSGVTWRIIRYLSDI